MRMCPLVAQPWRRSCPRCSALTGGRGCACPRDRARAQVLVSGDVWEAINGEEAGVRGAFTGVHMGTVSIVPLIPPHPARCFCNAAMQSCTSSPNRRYSVLIRQRFHQTICPILTPNRAQTRNNPRLYEQVSLKGVTQPVEVVQVLPDVAQQQQQ